MKGVMFGDKHSYDDFGLIFISSEVSTPAPQINEVSVPLIDGVIDLTEVLTGDIKYSNRAIKLNFAYMGQRAGWTNKMSELTNALHGKKMKIILDDDMAFYYTGRVFVNKWESDKSIARIAIDCEVEPYKISVQSSAEEWLWDPFDFENGAINEFANVEVNGTETVVLIGRRKKVNIIITVSSNMTLQFHGKSYNLTEGENVMYEIFPTEGENELIFNGNGTASISYTGGVL